MMIAAIQSSMLASNGGSSVAMALPYSARASGRSKARRRRSRRARLLD